MSILIETTAGDVVIDLFVKQRPRSCLNFIKLCKIKYYNNTLFHSIEQNYIAQTGDPTGTGKGGESIFGILYGEQARFFEKEILPPKMRHVKKGLIAMVNNGAEAHGSQFYFTLSDENLHFLDNEHTIFGIVAEGMETIEKLNTVLCDDDNKPYIDIRITHTVILHDPFDDPKGIEIPPLSPSPNEDLLKSSRIGIEDELDEFIGMTDEERAERIKEKEARSRAHVLEMVGDIRDVDDVPPDNVLFVCKLNKLTQDDELELIFSRFGKIKCCEIIRDKKTGISLHYAFIEFEDPKACEAAFFKMDNVLIDDRRIHVDFSQSVAKNYQWERKQPDLKPNMKIEKSEDRLSRLRDDRSPRRREKRRRSRSPRRVRSRERTRRDRSRSRERHRNSRRHR